VRSGTCDRGCGPTSVRDMTLSEGEAERAWPAATGIRPIAPASCPAGTRRGCPSAGEGRLLHQGPWTRVRHPARLRGEDAARPGPDPHGGGPGQAAGPDPDAVGYLNMSELLLQRLLARARAGFASSSHSEGQYHERHHRLYHRPGGAVDSGQAVDRPPHPIRKGAQEWALPRTSVRPSRRS
jgi:hypothetical protein